jgi:hypothetical protein
MASEWKRQYPCVGHGRKNAKNACIKLFYTHKSLAAHNAWAHKASVAEPVKPVTALDPALVATIVAQVLKSLAS